LLGVTEDNFGRNFLILWHILIIFITIDLFCLLVTLLLEIWLLSVTY